MKKNEIKKGGLYRARVSGNLVTVKVLAITEREKFAYQRGGTSYRVLNLTTGRETSFRSAAKFRQEVTS